MIKTTKSLVPMQRKVNVLAGQVESLAIVDATSMQKGVVMLSTMNQYCDKVKEQKEELTKPINESLKNIRAMFKPLETTYETAIELLRGKMTVYNDAQVKERAAAEQKLADRVNRGTLKIDTAVRKMDELVPIEKEISTSAGLVQFREIKILKIIDPSLIPREYLVIDEKKIMADLKSGKTVAGAVLEDSSVVVNYR